MSLMHHGTTAQTMYPEGACHWLGETEASFGLLGRAHIGPEPRSGCRLAAATASNKKKARQKAQKHGT